MASTAVPRFSGFGLLKGAALAAVVCLWPALGWAGMFPSVLFALFLLTVSATAAAIPMAVTLLFLILRVSGVGLPLPAWLNPALVALVLTAAAALAMGSRLFGGAMGRLARTDGGALRIHRLRRGLALLALLSLAAASLKAVDLPQMLLLAALFGLAWWRLRAMAPPPRGAWRNAAVTAAMLLAALLLSAAVMEGGARLLLPDLSRARKISLPDPDYMFTLRPNSAGTNFVALDEKGTKKTVSLLISGQGLRDRTVPPKAPGELRIAMIGDSFTMGHAAAEEDTIPRQLEARLQAAVPGRPVRVLNCGIGGGGPLQELGMLMKRALPLEPNLVILQLYLGNDVQDALETVNRHPRAYNTLAHQKLMDLRFAALPQFRVENWAIRNLRAYQALRTATDERWLVRLLERFRGVPHADTRFAPSENRPERLETDLVNGYPELDQGFEIIKRHIAQMRAECAKRGVGFMAYCIPDLAEVSDERWNAATAGEGKPAYERMRGITLMSRFFAEQSIPCLSVVDALRAAGPIEDVYYVFDGHLTERGNAAVAQAWAEYLASGYLKTARLPS